MGQILTLKQLYRRVCDIISEAAGDSAEFEAAQLICFHTDANKTTVFSDPFREIEKNICDAILLDAKRRSTGEPLQYILGEWEFYGLDFYVGEGVLIPRADTETLVDEALKLLEKKESPLIADLCSGSGCIAITLAKERPDSFVTAVDLYETPLEFIRKNTLRNGVQNVNIIKGDVLQLDADFSEGKKFDLIVSNPPYIDATDMELLSSEVKHEPHEALFGGTDGLDFYRAILHSQTRFLKSDGSLAVEIGYNQADSVRTLFKEHFKSVHTVRDLNGVQRVIIGTLPQ